MLIVHVDRRIGAVAAGQDSLITWNQLRELGLGRGAIDHRVRRGVLHRVHQGVFCWGVPSDSPWTAARGAARWLPSSRRDLAEAVERAQVRRLVHKREIAAAISRAEGRRGVPALRALLDEPAFTRSRAERLLVGLLRASRLPEPAFNAYVGELAVDALWRASASCWSSTPTSSMPPARRSSATAGGPRR